MKSKNRNVKSSYTLHIATFCDYDNAIKFVDTYFKNNKKLRVLKILKNGIKYYKAIYGIYNTKNDALSLLGKINSKCGTDYLCKVIKYKLDIK